MSIGWKILGVVAVASALLGASLPARAAGPNVCDTQAQRIQCSEQCCGRKSCPPSCEADCVRACVTACKEPAKRDSYTSQMQAYQQRCGNRSVR